MTKPTKPSVIIPASFAIDGVKTEFDNTKIQNGFDRLQPDVLAGDNLNKLIDDNCKVNNYALDLGDYVLGKDVITNCILEAPNGVATFSGDKITVKQGLKVLIPNGRNADGTLKNIEYTLPNDVTAEQLVAGGVNNNLPRILFINSNGTQGSCFKYNYYISETIPDGLTSAARILYKPSENILYYCLANQINWTPISLACIADFTTTATEVTSLTPHQAINLLKYSNKSEISGWGMPSNNFVNLTLGADGTTYTAPANGWVTIQRRAQAIGELVQLINISSGLSIRCPAPKINYLVMCFIPVLKGETFIATYTTTGGDTRFRFIYAEGEV